MLRALITQSSLPLKSVEVDFAVDSSGFATSRFTRWFDHKYGKERAQHQWVKCHLMCGVKTNIVTAIEIHGPHAADTFMLPPLLAATAKNFHVAEVSADKGYKRYFKGGDIVLNESKVDGGNQLLVHTRVVRIPPKKAG